MHQGLYCLISTSFLLGLWVYYQQDNLTFLLQDCLINIDYQLDCLSSQINIDE